MKLKVRDRIIEIVRTSGGVRPHTLALDLQLSPQAIHRHLHKLLSEGILERRGKSPQVIYVLRRDENEQSNWQAAKSDIPAKDQKSLHNHFCYFTPQGDELSGVRGFISFLERTNQAQDPAARAKEYAEIVSGAERFRDSDGLINGTRKLADTFGSCELAALYYSAFYSLPKYGKSKLGQYLLHGKSGQNKELIRRIAAETKVQVEKILSRHKIDAIAFIPHSIPRKLPFLIEYRRLLKLNKPEVKLVKSSSGIPVAQKSLSKLSERIENARETIFVADNSFSYKRVLIIDDALGSGATMNEVAKKLVGTGREIYGYAIVGSYKGFEVLNEV